MLIPGFRKTWMLSRGEWRPGNPKSRVAGFWISQLYSPWKDWGKTAVEFLEAKDNPETLRTFINTALGELWDDEAQTSVDVATLLARREHYGPKLPAGVAVLTCGVDVQADRLELKLVGWGRGEESWSIEYRVLPGDPSAPGVWSALDEDLGRTWVHERGLSLPISVCCIDSGSTRSRFMSSPGRASTGACPPSRANQGKSPVRCRFGPVSRAAKAARCCTPWAWTARRARSTAA